MGAAKWGIALDSGGTEGGHPMKIVFDNEDFDGQFLRALSYAAYGGADIGECFETATNIKEGIRSPRGGVQRAATLAAVRKSQGIERKGSKSTFQNSSATDTGGKRGQK